jgi:hypothetical protein
VAREAASVQAQIEISVVGRTPDFFLRLVPQSTR